VVRKKNGSYFESLVLCICTFVLSLKLTYWGSSKEKSFQKKYESSRQIHWLALWKEFSLVGMVPIHSYLRRQGLSVEN
jgi:hypothetical protein